MNSFYDAENGVETADSRFWRALGRKSRSARAGWFDLEKEVAWHYRKTLTRVTFTRRARDWRATVCTRDYQGSWVSFVFAGNFDELQQALVHTVTSGRLTFQHDKYA
jgi:hypothetical protein